MNEDLVDPEESLHADPPPPQDPESDEGSKGDRGEKTPVPQPKG